MTVKNINVTNRQGYNLKDNLDLTDFEAHRPTHQVIFSRVSTIVFSTHREKSHIGFT